MNQLNLDSVSLAWITESDYGISIIDWLTWLYYCNLCFPHPATKIKLQLQTFFTFLLCNIQTLRQLIYNNHITISTTFFNDFWFKQHAIIMITINSVEFENRSSSRACAIKVASSRCPYNASRRRRDCARWTSVCRSLRTSSPPLLGISSPCPDSERAPVSGTILPRGGKSSPVGRSRKRSPVRSREIFAVGSRRGRMRRRKNHHHHRYPFRSW